MFTKKKVVLTHGVPHDLSWEGGGLLGNHLVKSLSLNMSIKISISHKPGLKFNQQTGASGFNEWIDGWNIGRWTDVWENKGEMDGRMDEWI